MVNVPVNAGIQPISIRAGTEAEVATGKARSESAVARVPGGPAELDQVGPRLKAMLRAARYHGIELDPNEFRAANGGAFPAAADLSEWAQNAGMWSRAVRIRWSTFCASRKPDRSSCVQTMAARASSPGRAPSETSSS